MCGDRKMSKIFAFWTRKKEVKNDEEQHIAVVEDPNRRVEEILYTTSAQKEIIDVADTGGSNDQLEPKHIVIQVGQKREKEWMFPNAHKKSVDELLRSRKKSQD